MPIPNLTIIGESINDSVPSTHKFFEANDMAGLKELAVSQDTGGAGYIDVNVGPRPAPSWPTWCGTSKASPPSRSRSTRRIPPWPKPDSRPTTASGRAG